MDETITGLLGDWALLNPAYLMPTEYDGNTYPSIIMAVEASKFPKEKRAPFISGVARAATLGYALPYTEEQLQVLEMLLRERFKPGTKFYECLMKTGNAEIVYTNDVHRNWFGACTCVQCANIPKKNYVGEILERIRDGK